MRDRLKAVRNSVGLSQQKFANDIGVSVSNIESYEMGRRTPSEAFIQLVCNKYDINETWLRSGEGDMRAPLDREQEIARITAQMFKADENDFRFQLQKIISELSEDQIDLLKDIALKMLESIK